MMALQQKQALSYIHKFAIKANDAEFLPVVIALMAPAGMAITVRGKTKLQETAP
jgi:hypothetical protein